MALALLDKLRDAKADVDWFCRAFACAQCGAAVGQPCTPRGPQHKTHPWHLTRQDRMMNASSRAGLPRHYEDLARGVAPALVLARLQKLQLYKLALRDGLLK